MAGIGNLLALLSGGAQGYTAQTNQNVKNNAINQDVQQQGILFNQNQQAQGLVGNSLNDSYQSLSNMPAPTYSGSDTTTYSAPSPTPSSTSNGDSDDSDNSVPYPPSSPASTSTGSGSNPLAGIYLGQALNDGNSNFPTVIPSSYAGNMGLMPAQNIDDPGGRNPFGGGGAISTPQPSASGAASLAKINNPYQPVTPQGNRNVGGPANPVAQQQGGQGQGGQNMGQIIQVAALKAITSKTATPQVKAAAVQQLIKMGMPIQKIQEAAANLQQRQNYQQQSLGLREQSMGARDAKNTASQSLATQNAAERARHNRAMESKNADGTGGSGGGAPMASGGQPLPPQMANSPDGTTIKDSAGTTWQKKGNQLVPLNG